MTRVDADFILAELEKAEGEIKALQAEVERLREALNNCMASSMAEVERLRAELNERRIAYNTGKEAEVERLTKENAEYVHRGLAAERAYEEAEAELEHVRAERDRFLRSTEEWRAHHEEHHLEGTG